MKRICICNHVKSGYFSVDEWTPQGSRQLFKSIYFWEAQAYYMKITSKKE